MSGEIPNFSERQARLDQILARQEAARNRLEERHGELVDRKYILASEGQIFPRKDKRELKRINNYMDIMDKPFYELPIEKLKAAIQLRDTPQT